MANKFDVKVRLERKTPYLSVTHNGYQWTSINIKDPRHEIPRIIFELAQYLRDMEA